MLTKTKTLIDKYTTAHDVAGIAVVADDNLANHFGLSTGSFYDDS
jgi:hypothetical protein